MRPRTEAGRPDRLTQAVARALFAARAAGFENETEGELYRMAGNFREAYAVTPTFIEALGEYGHAILAIEDESASPVPAPTLDVERLRAAIEDVLGTLERVVTDAESQHPGGWGPDVTTVADLRDCQVILRAALAASSVPAPTLDVDAQLLAMAMDIAMDTPILNTGLRRVDVVIREYARLAALATPDTETPWSDEWGGSRSCERLRSPCGVPRSDVLSRRGRSRVEEDVRLLRLDGPGRHEPGAGRGTAAGVARQASAVV